MRMYVGSLLLFLLICSLLTHVLYYLTVCRSAASIPSFLSLVYPLASHQLPPLAIISLYISMYNYILYIYSTRVSMKAANTGSFKGAFTVSYVRGERGVCV